MNVVPDVRRSERKPDDRQPRFHLVADPQGTAFPIIGFQVLLVRRQIQRLRFSSTTRGLQIPLQYGLRILPECLTLRLEDADVPLRQRTDDAVVGEGGAHK